MTACGQQCEGKEGGSMKKIKVIRRGVGNPHRRFGHRSLEGGSTGTKTWRRRSKPEEIEGWALQVDRTTGKNSAMQEGTLGYVQTLEAGLTGMCWRREQGSQELSVQVCGFRKSVFCSKCNGSSEEGDEKPDSYSIPHQQKEGDYRGGQEGGNSSCVEESTRLAETEPLDSRVSLWWPLRGPLWRSSRSGGHIPLWVMEVGMFTGGSELYSPWWGVWQQRLRPLREGQRERKVCLE